MANNILAPHLSLHQRLKKCGQDVLISPMVDIRRPHLVEIGDHVAIDSFFVCTTSLKLGSYIHISPQVGVIGGAQGQFEMEDFTFLSLGANIICGGENFQGDGLVGPIIPMEYRDTTTYAPVIIKKYAGVGAGSTILPGAVISEGSVIGAHSLVLKNFVTEPWTIYAGCPVRPIKKRNPGNMLEYATKLIPNSDK